MDNGKNMNKTSFFKDENGWGYKFENPIHENKNCTEPEFSHGVIGYSSVKELVRFCKLFKQGKKITDADTIILFQYDKKLFVREVGEQHKAYSLGGF